MQGKSLNAVAERPRVPCRLKYIGYVPFSGGAASAGCSMSVSTPAESSVPRSTATGAPPGQFSRPGPSIYTHLVTIPPLHSKVSSPPQLRVIMNMSSNLIVQVFRVKLYARRKVPVDS